MRFSKSEAIRAGRFAALAASCLALANCANKHSSENKYGVSASARVVEAGEPVPKGGGSYRIGKPYVVGGRTYIPEENPSYRAEGMASWYGDDFHGRLTANGEVFDKDSISAAHPTLPMPSYVRVTNLQNHRSMVVRVNDRGPYERGREIDLSMGAAKLLGFHGNGLARVRVEYVGKAPLDGSDDRKLVATLREHRDEMPGRVPTLVASARLPAGTQDRSPDRFADRTSSKLPPLASEGASRRASERPFAPEFFDSTPMTTRGGPIPVTDENEHAAIGQASHGPARGTPLVTASEPFDARDPKVLRSTLDAPVQTVPARNPPVSAYAATRYDGSASVVSGRGLY